MADVPGPSTAPYFSPRKATENFSRLCQLIMTICSDLFRNIFSQYIKPVNLRTELDNNRARLLTIKGLNTAQRNLLYPVSPVNPLTSKDMDLSLLYILLRNICKIPPHRTGWGNAPGNGDNSLAACIERIRINRNLIYGHCTRGEIDDTLFQDVWSKLRYDIVEIEMQLIGGTMYQVGVDELFSCELNPSRAKKYVEEFRNIHSELLIKHERVNDLEGSVLLTKHHMAIKRARIDDIEEEQTSEAKAVKDKLSRMEENMTDTLSRMEGNMTDVISRMEKNITARIDAIEEQRTSDTRDLKARIDSIEGQGSSDAKDLIGMKQSFPLLLKSTIPVPSMFATTHISVLTPDALWVSDGYTLKQVNAKGDVIKTLPREYVLRSEGGIHSVSKEGDLFFIAESAGVSAVYRMTPDGRIAFLFKSDIFYNFTCLHCSYINRDILIGSYSNDYTLPINFGMRGLRYSVRRYDSTGRMKQEIEFKDPKQREKLYNDQQYITENRINGDIVVSDPVKRAVVVVDRSGRHRFDYTGRNSREEFNPGGVCTDVLGRIIVAHHDGNTTNCISLLDQDGLLLTELLRDVSDVYARFIALCVDDRFNIYFGEGYKINVYREVNFPGNYSFARSQLCHMH